MTVDDGMERFRRMLVSVDLPARVSGYELGGRLRGLRSLRVGSYRIVYQLVDDQRTVRGVAILRRAVAYRTDQRQSSRRVGSSCRRSSHRPLKRVSDHTTVKGLHLAVFP